MSAIDNIFKGPPNGIAAPASTVSLGLDVTNNVLYASSGNGWQEIGSSSGNTLVSVFGENVQGSGTSWTLANIPNNASNVILFGFLESFGFVALSQGMGNPYNYVISEANITTNQSFTMILACYDYIGSGNNTIVFGENVSGSGTSWTLANTPNSSFNIILFGLLPDFGFVALIQGTGNSYNYTISGAIITTNQSFVQVLACYTY